MKYRDVRFVMIEKYMRLVKYIVYHRYNFVKYSIITRFSHFEYVDHCNVRIGLFIFIDLLPKVI